MLQPACRTNLLCARKTMVKAGKGPPLCLARASKGRASLRLCFLPVFAASGSLCDCGAAARGGPILATSHALLLVCLNCGCLQELSSILATEQHILVRAYLVRVRLCTRTSSGSAVRSSSQQPSSPHLYVAGSLHLCLPVCQPVCLRTSPRALSQLACVDLELSVGICTYIDGTFSDTGLVSAVVAELRARLVARTATSTAALLRYQVPLCP